MVKAGLVESAYYAAEGRHYLPEAETADLIRLNESIAKMLSTLAADLGAWRLRKAQQQEQTKDQERPIRCARRSLECLRQTEVEDFDGAVRLDLHVGGFQVTMNDALFVRSLERRSNLLRKRERLVDRNRPAQEIRSASVGPSTSSITSAVVPSLLSKP